MKIDIFTSSTCASCQVLKSRLEAAGIPFQSKDFFDNIDEASKLNIKALPGVFVHNGETYSQVTGTVDSIFETLKQIA